MGSAGLLWALEMLGNNPRCGREQPLQPRRQVVPRPSLASGGAKWSTFWRPHLSLCAFAWVLGIASGLHCCWKEAGPLPLKLLLLLGFPRRPLQEPQFWLGLLPGPEHICPQHLSLSQALTVTTGPPGGFVLSHSSRMLGNGTELVFRKELELLCLCETRV